MPGTIELIGISSNIVSTVVKMNLSSMSKQKVWMCLYVDDLICIGNSVGLMEEFKSSMINDFEMTDLGLMSYFIGLEVKQHDGNFISQEKYVNGLLEKFNVKECNPVKLPINTN